MLSTPHLCRGNMNTNFSEIVLMNTACVNTTILCSKPYFENPVVEDYTVDSSKLTHATYMLHVVFIVMVGHSY